MALLCPKCEELNKCDCITCNPDGKATDLVIILKDEQLYQCCFCGHKFDEQDSLDHDWNKLMQRFYTEITPKMCLDWISVIGKERKKLEEKYGSFGFECSFAHHFNMSYKDCNVDTYKKLLIQVERDIQLDKLCD